MREWPEPTMRVGTLVPVPSAEGPCEGDLDVFETIRKHDLLVLPTSSTSAPTASGPSMADELVTSNLPLVGHVVRDTMMRVPGHVDRDDLTSAGLVALVKAGRSFDPERGVPFARYAATRIRGAVLDELRAVDWAPRSVRRRARDLDQARARLG